MYMIMKVDDKEQKFKKPGGTMRDKVQSTCILIYYYLLLYIAYISLYIYYIYSKAFFIIKSMIPLILVYKLSF